MRNLLFLVFTFLSITVNSQLQLSSIPAAGMNEPNMIDVCSCDVIEFSIVGELTDATSIDWFVDDVVIDSNLNPTLPIEFCSEGIHNVRVEIVINEFLATDLNTTVRVAIQPEFDNELVSVHNICQNETVLLPGGFTSNTEYYGFDIVSLQNNSVINFDTIVNFAIPDNDGCYNASIQVNNFSNTDEIETTDDINALLLNLEHTYMGDLIITYICPNGNSIITHQQGGGSNNLGNNGGFDYSWTNNENDELWTEADLIDGSLPEGDYQSLETFENFIGCPLNGTWSIEICDVWSNDLGYVYEWGIQFNSSIDSLAFTTEPVNASWQASEWISQQTDSTITINQTSNTEEYIFTVEDNFGCSYQQIVPIAVAETIDLDLANETNLYCIEQVLVIEEEALEACNEASGNYNYCYSNDEDVVWTYCPDVPGDGTTLSVEFNTGFLENNYDYIYIYDGDNIDAPLMEILNGELTDLSFVSSNENGCITIQLVTDYSVNCGENGYDNINYTIACGNANNYNWNWEPAEYLNNPNTPNLEINEVTNDVMIFSATITSEGFEDCPEYHDVVVYTENFINVGDDNEGTVCITDQNISLFNFLGGEPTGEGIWFNENEEPVSGSFTPDSLGVFYFNYTFDNCEASSLVTITVASNPETPSILADDYFLVTEIYDSYQWYFEGQLLDGITGQSYNAPADGNYHVEVFNIEGCSAVSQEIFVGENTDNIFDFDRINFSIAPNPFDNFTTISFENNSQYQVKLFSIDGQLLREYLNIQNQIKIERDDLAKGIYTLQISSLESKTMKNIKLAIK